MKEEVKISVVQFASEWLQPEVNRQRMKSFVETEAKQGAELIVLPELVNTGYISPVGVGQPVGFEDMDFTQFASRFWRAAEPIPGPTTEALSEVTRRYGVYVVLGMAQHHPVIRGTLYNSGVLIGPRGVIGVHHKMHIPLEEKHFFYPGNTSEVFQTELGNIGIVICYDARFPELSRVLTLKGAEIICNMLVIPLTTGLKIVVPDAENYLIHRGFTRAQENGVYFISASLPGREGKTQFLGHSCIAAPNGETIVASQTTEEDVIRATLTEERLINFRTAMNLLLDRRPEMYSTICKPLSEPFRPAAVTPSEAEQATTPVPSEG